MKKLRKKSKSSLQRLKAADEKEALTAVLKALRHPKASERSEIMRGLKS